jgi:hypothetical protein
MNKPNFFIFMCKPKEPFYFCADFREESDKYYGREMRFPLRTEKQYLQLFDNADRQKVIGEATPEYLYSKVAAKLIHDFNPSAKILILLREPVDFLYSMHSQMYFFAGEDIADFEQALDAEPKRLAGNCLPSGLLWPSSLYYSERVKFSQQLQRYIEIFPESQIKIILYDEFRKDNQGIYQSILEFLHVDVDYKPEMGIYNANKTVRSQYVLRIFMALSDLPVKNVLPARYRQVLARKIKVLNMKRAERGILDPCLRQSLMEQLKPEVARLSELVQRDLGQLWGYDKL